MISKETARQVGPLHTEFEACLEDMLNYKGDVDGRTARIKRAYDALVEIKMFFPQYSTDYERVYSGVLKAMEDEKYDRH